MASRLTRQGVSLPDLQFWGHDTDSDRAEKLNRLMNLVRAQAREIQKLQAMLQGGTAAQSLKKRSAADYDAGWQ